jgi:transketolase
MASARIKKLKRQILMAAHTAGEGHIPSAFSILDILWVLYDQIMDISVACPGDITKDRFVLSKGHASLALYAILAEKGFFSAEKLMNFGTYSSDLGGHPDCNKVPGVVASTGSLGHGFPIAVGIALGSKIRGFTNRTFCLVGDGECNEGTIWESALLAAHHNLSNLCCIIDFNHSTDRALGLGNLASKFQSFDWETIIIEGHDHEAIFKALNTQFKNKPVAIIANTIKGAGIKKMENEPAWHHRVPNKEEVNSFLEELL